VAAYPASKAALNALTVQYAKELRPLGILVNAGAPGACATDFTKSLGMAISRTAADGAAIAVKLATLGPGGPTGGFSTTTAPCRGDPGGRVKFSPLAWLGWPGRGRRPPGHPGRAAACAGRRWTGARRRAGRPRRTRSGP